MNDFHNKQIMHVTNVTLRVKDLQKMLDFYQNVLKMTLIKSEDNLYQLGTKDSRVLVTLVEDKNAVTGAKTTGLYHFAILLPTRHDLGVFLNYYLKNKYPLTGASDHDVSEALYLDDPEGNGIEIYMDRPSEKWKFNGKEVLMTTVAIDHVSLLKEVGEYSEIPKDTIMGHLHLHVNNISKAHEFFVNTLGFHKMLDYGPTASFISDGNYHHHIAYNTWLGSNNPSLGKHQTGLMTYQVNLPATYLSELLKKLDKAKIAYTTNHDQIYLQDINGTDIELVIS